MQPGSLQRPSVLGRGASSLRDSHTDARTRSPGPVPSRARPRTPQGTAASLAVGLTKTGRDRAIAVDPGTAALIRAWPLSRAELGLHLVRPDSLIFSDAEGRHLHPERFSRTFQQTQERCRKEHPDLPIIRLHDLRHTHATILRKGVPVKAVSVRLGHTTPVVTMTVYAGWMPADDANAAAVFASRIGEAI